MLQGLVHFIGRHIKIMSTVTTKISRWDGGISDDPRAPSPNGCALVKHFNIFDNPHRLTPYRSTKNEQTATSVADFKLYDVRDFQLSVNGQVYGLGRIQANNYPKILTKADPTTGNWTAPATAQATGTPARINGCFIEWQSTFWLFSGTTNVSRWVIGSTFTDAYATLGATITSVAQGVIANNTLYIFYNNRVVTVSAASVVTDNVFTAIPSDMRITSVCRWGNYLAIGCAYGTSNINISAGRSIVVLWDMVSSTTASDVIDWGEGTLRVLANVEGRLVGVSDKYLTSTLGLTRGSMVVRMWAGGVPQVVKEVVANQTVTADATAFPNTITRFPSNVVVKGNKMYWVASVPFDLSTTTESTYHLGIWVFGRKNVNSNFALAVDFVEEGVATGSWYINSFGAAGDYWFINHSSDGSVSSTDNTANYTFTSISESQIFNGGDVASYKDLVDVTVGTVPLPTAGQLVLQYRIDAQTSYTTIFTNTTDNSISHTANNIESSGAALPKDYKEIQFRIQSTGFAEPTELSFNEEVKGRRYNTA